MDKEYTAGEAKAWLSGYDSGKAFAKKEWVGLTDEEYTELWGKKPFLLNFFRKIEAKLKEKNSTSERSIQISDSQAAESSQP